MIESNHSGPSVSVAPPITLLRGMSREDTATLLSACEERILVADHRGAGVQFNVRDLRNRNLATTTRQ